jgi:uncharacterized sporulation protein YeaH/YhbH (DUF444 family)
VLHQIIDRRLAGKNKSIANRERFLRRFKGQIQRSVADAVRDRSITDLKNRRASASRARMSRALLPSRQAAARSRASGQPGLPAG